MTKLMDQAIDSLKKVPAELQDEIARVVMELTGGGPPAYKLTHEEKADLDAADAELARGEIATDEQVRAIWAKHGLGSSFFLSVPPASLKIFWTVSRNATRKAPATCRRGSGKFSTCFSVSRWPAPRPGIGMADAWSQAPTPTSSTIEFIETKFASSVSVTRRADNFESV